VLVGGGRRFTKSGLENGYYVQPTVFEGAQQDAGVPGGDLRAGHLSVTTFKTTEEAIEIANDTLYGLGAGVWTRDTQRLPTHGPRAIQAGRVWVNCYHPTRPTRAFGGYKQSGIGRETHKMMLNHYQQTKNLLVSYDENALGFF
jgi:aldehyde dehydrogenase